MFKDAPAGKQEGAGSCTPVSYRGEKRICILRMTPLAGGSWKEKYREEVGYVRERREMVYDASQKCREEAGDIPFSGAFHRRDGVLPDCPGDCRENRS